MEKWCRRGWKREVMTTVWGGSAVFGVSRGKIQPTGNALHNPPVYTGRQLPIGTKHQRKDWVANVHQTNKQFCPFQNRTVQTEKGSLLHCHLCLPNNMNSWETDNDSTCTVQRQGLLFQDRTMTWNTEFALLKKSQTIKLKAIKARAFQLSLRQCVWVNYLSPFPTLK